MEIRRTTLKDIDKVLDLYAEARQFMKENGNATQWIDGYPKKTLIESDINTGKSYVCIHENEIVAVFYYSVEMDPTYQNIEQGSWLNDSKYAVIHRITTNRVQPGVASYCVDWCFKKHSNIRIDTHRDNVPMHKFLTKNGFSKCGIIYIENGDERIAYHKSL